MYSFFKRFLFLLDAEKAHYVTMWCFTAAMRVPGMSSLLRSLFHPSSSAGKTVAGLYFKNPVGLAAGFDKNARFIRAMALLGFSHVEVGTVTPKPQSGNPKPRLFRLKKSEALINRMGFNNDGVDAMAAQLRQKRPHDIIVGANIGKNKDTPNEEAIRDYEICFTTLYPLVDYFTVNVSSPNTPGLRELQDKEPLTRLLSRLQELNTESKPVFLKIAPDLTPQQLEEIAGILIHTRLTGVIATNTTISRDGLAESKAELDQIGNGGMSGRPLHSRSVEVVSILKHMSEGKYAVIGVGGISDGATAKDFIHAGADLVQVYSGLIYAGPSMVRKIMRHLA